MTRTTKIILAILGVFIVVLLISTATKRNRPETDDQSLNTTGLVTTGNTVPDTSNWKTYTIPGTSVTFSYPQNWSISTTDEGNNNTRLKITAPDSFTIDSLYGNPSNEAQCTDTTDTNTDMGSETVALLNNTYNLYYTGSRDANTISYAYLSNEQFPCTSIPAISVPPELNIPNTAQKAVSTKIYYQNNSEMPADQFKGNDLNMAKQIMASLSNTTIQ